jgi:hypothetical protein
MVETGWEGGHVSQTVRHPAIPQVEAAVDAQQAGSSWRTLYRAAGAAALITAVLIPIQIAVFIAYPFPDTVAGWFRLLQDDALAGLVDLDLLLVVDNVLLVVIALAVSGVVLWVWYLLVARRFFQLGRSLAPSVPMAGAASPEQGG